MKRFSTKTVLPVICIVAIVLATVGTVFAAGGAVFPWREEKSSVEKILERDGYLEGIWYPWFTHKYLGCSLASNDLMTKYVGSGWSNVGLDQIGENAILRDIVNLKAIGFNIMGYEGSPYGEGVIFDDNGDVLGIKPEYLRNVRRFLELCRTAKMPVLWTVCFHSSTISEYYGKQAWDIISQMYANKTVSDHYAERFVKPLCDVLGEYKDVVVMIASSVELENETNDSEMGNHFDDREVYGVTQEAMCYFVNAITDAVAEKLPDIGRTISTNSSNMSVYNHMKFDMLGRNWYTENATIPAVSTFHSSLPMLVTEFGLGDGTTVVQDEAFTLKHIKFRNNFIENGYRGWFMWCWQPNTFGTSYSLLSKDAVSMSDFREMAYALHFYVEDYRSAHRGEETVLDKPTLFYQSGSGLVEWIGARQATALDLYRSNDGGKSWTKLLDAVNPDDYENGYKGSYRDTALPESGTITYRVAVYDDDNHTVYSDPSNTANVKEPAPNLVVNGSFETGDLSNWESFGSNGTQFNATVADFADEAPDGTKVLDFSYINKEWFGIHQSGIEVKPNTNYIISYMYKRAEDAVSPSGYCFIRGKKDDGTGNGKGDLNDAVLASIYLNSPDAATEWVRDSVSIRTNNDKLGIDFRTIAGVHFYIDDVQLKESD